MIEYKVIKSKSPWTGLEEHLFEVWIDGRNVYERDYGSQHEEHWIYVRDYYDYINQSVENSNGGELVLDAIRIAYDNL